MQKTVKRVCKDPLPTFDTCVQADGQAHGRRHARTRRVQCQLGDRTPDGVDALWHINDRRVTARGRQSSSWQRDQSLSFDLGVWSAGDKDPCPCTHQVAQPTRSPSVRQIALTRRSGQFFSMLYTLPA
jgi:hypothetical protein